MRARARGAIVAPMGDRRIALLVAISAAALPAAAVVVGNAPPPPAPVVRAQVDGLRLATRDLAGAVALVASRPVDRWRLVGATGWRPARGRVLSPRFDTIRIRDGRYVLELRAGGRTTTQPLSIRNSTYLPTTLIANASAGLDIRSTDATSVAAAFARRSYAPGEVAALGLSGRYAHLRVQVLHVGPEQQLTIGDRTLEGVPVGDPIDVAAAGRTLRFTVGDWPSGFYAARLTSGSKVGFAPFIVRPAQLGASRVAVIEPTNTWQAYNYRDSNHDGVPDTWYYRATQRTVDLARPFLDRGVPPHFRQYDLTFLRWLARSGKQVDMLAQDDVQQLSGERLRQLYDLIVFPGHEEYATEAEYDAVQRYRDLGGNLAFLSANNFFWRVNQSGDTITRIGLWRDLGRPEAALVGVEYFDWNHGVSGSAPYVVDSTAAAPWLFAGTGVADGSPFGAFGIESDHRTADSPPQTQVLAQIPDVFGSGQPAEMTYYVTSAGAHVFAAGAFTLAGTDVRCPSVSRFLENLWDELTNAPAADRLAPANVDLGPCPLASG